MISISQLGASVLYKTLEESEIQSGQSFRLVREEEGFLLKLDSPVKTDRVIRYNGALVLMIDKDLENELGNARIDIEETTEGCNLVMRRTVNPNVIVSNITGVFEVEDWPNHGSKIDKTQ